MSFGTHTRQAMHQHVVLLPCHKCLGTGDRYDGEFTQGKEEGLGIFTWADGTTYEGHWQNGQKHGIGLYRPASEHDRRGTPAPAPGRHEGVTAGAEACCYTVVCELLIVLPDSQLSAAAQHHACDLLKDSDNTLLKCI